MSSMTQRVGILQGQEMGSEVKSGALVAGRGYLLSCREGEQFQRWPDFITQLGLS